jgi:hypothetical protein
MGRWRKPDGKKVEGFTIITTEPNELLRPIHNRMPVILNRKTKSNGLTLLDTIHKSQITVEALSRRADGCSRHFNNRQLGEVRRLGVFNLFQKTRYLAVGSCPFVSNIKILDHSVRPVSTFGGIVRPICFAVLRLMTNSSFWAAPPGGGWLSPL